MNETTDSIFSSVEDAQCSQNVSVKGEPIGSSHNVAVAIFSSLLIIVILLGNGLIFVSVCLVRKLRQPANYLIVSLAFSDFLVAFIVLPLNVAYDILGEWVFGSTLCNIHVSVDVICCATSILNLVMISIDRYLMITRPFWYPKKRTAKLMGGMIVSVWVLACLVIFPALFGFTKNVTDEPGYINLTLTDQFQRNSTTEKPFNASIGLETVLQWTLCGDNEIWQATVDLNEEHSINKSVGVTLAGSDQFLEMTLIRKNVSDVSQISLFFNSSSITVTKVRNVAARFIRISMNETQRQQFANTSLDLYAVKLEGRNCLISQELWFTIYSTVSSFYIPLAIMLFMYYKIYLEASRLEARERARTRSLSNDVSERGYSMFFQSTRRKTPSIALDDSSSDLTDYLEMRRRSNSNQTNCSKGQDNEQSARRLPANSRDEETCAMLPPDGDYDRNDKCGDANDENSCRHIGNACGINGNSSENSRKQSQTQPSKTWCKNLHYSSSSVSQSEGSGLISQSSRRSRYRSQSCSTKEKSELPFVRSILSTRKKSFLGRNPTISFRSERKSSSFLRRNFSVQREKMRNVKAIRTLGIIVLVFTFCWLPFFVLTFLRPFICQNPESTDCLPGWLVRLVLWLGYINSAMNPIIYVGFNSELRDTFVLLLLCKCTNVDRRLARGEVRRAIENERKYNARL